MSKIIELVNDGKYTELKKILEAKVAKKVVEKIQSEKQNFVEEEESLKAQIEEFEKSQDVLNRKIHTTELKLNEQNIILEQLKSQSITNEREHPNTLTP